MIATDDEGGSADALRDAEVVKAMRGLLKNKELLFETAARLRRWCGERFTTDRWLDENEREWYALDRLCRSRPWATNREEAFAYPFREATERMRQAEGPWVGDEQATVRCTRGAAACDVIVQLNVTPVFPPEHRVLLFTPEFGSHTSFDAESWGYMEPEEKVDLWAVCWQGWTDFDTMIQQVTRRVLSFADGVNTIWFGQGAGALVAYEVLKAIESGVQTPNLPVGLVVSDCPAPHAFSQLYRPAEQPGWEEALDGAGMTAERRRRVAADLATMASYRFRHAAGREGVRVAVAALRHEGDPLVGVAAARGWEQYAPFGQFTLTSLGDADSDMGGYVQGTRYCFSADPEVLSTLTHMCETYSRWLEDAALPDIGPLDGPLPDQVDCVVVGAGIFGIYQAHSVAAAGKTVVCLDRFHEIGGVWNFYGNDYSRVNTSEIGYRIVERSGAFVRPNEDHTPRRDIMRDMYVIASQHLRGKIHCSVEVVSIEKLADGQYNVHTRHVKTGAQKTIRAGGVSMHVNRRIGKCRQVDWEGSHLFRGDIFYGYGNAMKDVAYWGKTVLVIGAGAFAFENVRTAIEQGARHVTLLGRRDGTTCPKWIDMISFLRPLDAHLMTHKSGNMISFECWQECYKRAGLRTPKCWEDGLLKPNNHTISVSDGAFIAGFHGLFKLQVGEIRRFRPDGMGVELVDGSSLDCNMVIKCTGFHLNDEVPKVTGLQKMQPYGLLDLNMNYGAEPLLDGGQFGSSKDKVEAQIDYSEIGVEEFMRGREALKHLGFNERWVEPHGNPFGSGQGGPIAFMAQYFAYLLEHPDEQEALLKFSGKPPQDVVNLWSSQIGEYQHFITTRLIAALGKAYGGAAPEN